MAMACVNRADTNDEVCWKAQDSLSGERTGQPKDKTRILELSAIHAKDHFYTELATAQEGDARAWVAFDTNTLSVHHHGQERVGRREVVRKRASGMVARGTRPVLRGPCQTT